MLCPYCEKPMSDCDSGEPEYYPGYWCDECREWFTEDDPLLTGELGEPE